MNAVGPKNLVYTDHKILIQDALGFTSDRVYRWRLLLEEYGPEIIYIKGIHNTVEDAISRLDFSPKVHPSVKTEQHNWMVLAKCWCAVENSHENSNQKFTMDLNKSQ